MISETNTLLELLLDENNKVPNVDGNTPLILKAIDNSKLDNFSIEKAKLEIEVCSLVSHFHKFNKTHFSELDSYISVSKFNLQNILTSFSIFIKEVEIDEDIHLKGFVLRFIQNFNKSLFQLDYIKERFQKLKEISPWLYAELLIIINWEDGVAQIAGILSDNDDTSYLFALITNWMIMEENEAKLNYAFKYWFKYLNAEDKELLDEFCKQYSYSTPSSQMETNSMDIIRNKEFRKFKSDVINQHKLQLNG